MTLVAIIATIILLSTLITMIFSFAAYLVTRAKASVKSKASAQIQSDTAGDPDARIFFVRYDPENPEGLSSRVASVNSADQWK